jgi:glyoxylase-like metal-dependent hydrolase (beta-lactamase superfamily II)
MTARAWIAASLAFLTLSGTALAQDMSKVEIKIHPVRDGIYMLEGQGGNIGLLVGNDGAFLIDDQFAPLTKKILAAVKKLNPKHPKFLVNTHWHFDHTGGNENLGEAGTVIVAHDNIRKRMSTKQFIAAFKRKVPPSPEAALPVITFSDGVTFHWNGETVRVRHIPRAHTDGDSIVHFTKANVIHTGDLVFNGIYPFIDASSGGRLDGVIRGVEALLEMADDDTRFIPGHGPLATMKDLVTYHDMLVGVSKAM